MNIHGLKSRRKSLVVRIKKLKLLKGKAREIETLINVRNKISREIKLMRERKALKKK